MNQLDLELVGRIKRLTVLAMISDDDLMELLIFKGGSAIDMIYNVSGRASLDLDFSMVSGLSTEEEITVGQKIKKVLEETFKEAGYLAHDITFGKRPVKVAVAVEGFWGGYQVKFKVISTAEAEKYDDDKEAIVRRSLPLGARGSTRFKIDISSYEYCATKKMEEFEDYTINVYTPEMIVFEKLRAICQQIPEYRNIVKSFTPKPRGRDFYDIELLIDAFHIIPTTKENKALIQNIFEIKNVPLDYIQQISDYREFHRENFETSLKDTVTKSEELQNFDYYFDYVLGQFEGLEF